MNLLYYLETVFVVLLPLSCVGENLKFPKGFSIGAASASYQIEGGWNAEGKGESLWDWYTHLKPSRIIDNSTGDVASDSYHNYKEDVKALDKIGFDHYRFSISWTRILPNGFANQTSIEGINYYHKLLDELNSKGIKPYVTLYHWDHPKVLEDLGGWMNGRMVKWFADYAKIVFKEFGSKVKVFLTINEPTVFCNLGYGMKYSPPGLNQNGSAAYTCVHNALKAHAKAYHIYDKTYRRLQKGQISIVLSCFHFFPEDVKDNELKELAFLFSCGWAAHPIFSKKGDYPKEMKKQIATNSRNEGLRKSKLPIFTKRQISHIRGSADFFAINHFSSFTLKRGPGLRKNPFFWDLDVHIVPNSNWTKTDNILFKVVPKGLRAILKLIKKHYRNPPIYIMENGVSDSTPNDDVKRINFFELYLTALLRAIHKDRCNVKAYTVWSLLDSFEWGNGYRDRFGLVHVDFNDPQRKRTLKKSALWFKELLSNPVRKLYVRKDTSTTYSG